MVDYYYYYYFIPLTFTSPLRSALRVGTAWVDFMNNNAPIIHTNFVAALRPLIPLIEAAAGKLMALANMNRTIHLEHYNRLIAEAAEKAAA